MSRAPTVSAIALASSVLPTPAGPSTSTGFSSRSARNTTPARRVRTSSIELNRSATALSPHLAVAPDDVLVRGQLAQAHRTARVQLLRRDTDLGAEPELFTVDEPSGGVHHNRGRVHLSGEPARRVEVLGEDHLGVTRPEPVDMVDRRVQ